MTPLTLPQVFARAEQHMHAEEWLDAAHLYRQVLAMSPQNSDALNFLGIALARGGQEEAACECLRQSIALQPGNAAYHDNFATILRDIGRPDEAIAHGRRAMELDPREPITPHNLANVLQDQGRLTEAIAGYDRARLLAPGYLSAHLGRARALTDLGRVREAIDAYRKVLIMEPGAMRAHSALLVNLHYLADFTPEMVAEEQRRWNINHVRPLPASGPAAANDPNPSRRLRVGYVSADFRDHPVAFFIEDLLARHDREAVEVFCYSSVPKRDAVTAQLCAYADHWRDIAALSDAQTAEIIRADQIDILVDLAGHTADHRLLVFARKPAPVQITWLGDCEATGLAAMDYLLTDGRLDPPGAPAAPSAERPLRLPKTWACYRPPSEAPEVGPSPAAQRGHVTFASFHTLAKINDPLLARWAQILAQVPNSRLHCAAFGLRDPSAQERLRGFFAKRGVTADRLEFRGWQSFPAYLAMHHEVDVVLDCDPFSGHTATCHALWMGVPVVTLPGEFRRSRLAASVLHNAGLPELIATSPGDYVRIACELAADLPQLGDLRGIMRERLSASPLCDGDRFARAVETAYREVWKKWCARKG